MSPALFRSCAPLRRLVLLLALSAGQAGLAQPATPPSNPSTNQPPAPPSDLFILANMSETSWTLPAGASQVFTAHAGGGAGPADQAIRWRLEGPGEICATEGQSVEYRGPRAGACSAVLTASLQRDPGRSVCYTITVAAGPAAAEPLPARVDLLPLLPLVAAERNQGNCSNCYAWAVTAALEMELSVRYGIKDRLSIQYFQSIYTPQSPDDPANACGPNPASLVTDIYRQVGKLVPWSNPHAEFRAASFPQVPAHFGEPIGLLPHYQIEQVSIHQIATHLWSNADIITELKTKLNQRKAIIFKSAGHYMVIVGYDSTAPDPLQHHWVVLDSRGVTAAMPEGTFRLPIHSVNYNHQDRPGHHVYTFEFIDPLLLKLQPEALPVATISANKPALSAGETLKLVASVTSRPPVQYQWLKDGQPLAGQTGSTLTLPAVTPADAGSYALAASNATGSAASAAVAVMVAPGLARPVAIGLLFDFNNDGVVDVLDLACLAQAFQAQRGQAHYLASADLNRDGRVGNDDAQAFLNFLDQQ